MLSAALLRHGRVIIAPPSQHSSSWRIFGGALMAEVNQQEGMRLCVYAVKGPDGKTLRQGVTSSLASALRLAAELLCQLRAGDYRTAA